MLDADLIALLLLVVAVTFWRPLRRVRAALGSLVNELLAPMLLARALRRTLQPTLPAPPPGGPEEIAR